MHISLLTDVMLQAYTSTSQTTSTAVAASTTKVKSVKRTYFDGWCVH